LRRFDQGVSSAQAAATGEEPGPFQSQEDLFEEFDGNMLSVCYLMALQDAASIGVMEFEQGAESVLAFFGEFHDWPT
jgi:hypothetical protein